MGCGCLPSQGRADIQGCQIHSLYLQRLSGDTGKPESTVAPIACNPAHCKMWWFVPVQLLAQAEMVPPFEEAGGVLEGPNSLGKGPYELLQVALSPQQSPGGDRLHW